ncbi:MAG: hypothetical protein PHE43_03755 [Candidatus Nanoarchaeia archaeon]|nr:hypothetical protein [Candidatus Nanoarchaeia archaeon]
MRHVPLPEVPPKLTKEKREGMTKFEIIFYNEWRKFVIRERKRIERDREISQAYQNQLDPDRRIIGVSAK